MQGKAVTFVETCLEVATTAIGHVQNEKAKVHFALNLEDKLKMAMASLNESAAVLESMASSEYAGNSEDIIKGISEANSRAKLAGQLCGMIDAVMKALEETEVFGTPT